MMVMIKDYEGGETDAVVMGIGESKGSQLLYFSNWTMNREEKDGPRDR